MTAAGCPLCARRVPAGADHCPGCGARLTALPRRGGSVTTRPRDVARPPGRRPGLPALAARAEVAALQGASAALGVTALLGAIAWGVARSGGDGGALFGNVALALGLLLTAVALLARGVRLRRWAAFDELRRRAESAGRVGVRRSAAAAAAAVLLTASAVTAILR